MALGRHLPESHQVSSTTTAKPSTQSTPIQSFGLFSFARTPFGEGGGGGGGSSGTTVTVTYTDPANSATGNVVLKLNAASSGKRLLLDVVVYGPLADVFSAAFHLQYDPALLTFKTATEGTVLNADACNGGDCTAFTVDGTSVANKVLIGLTRKSPGVGIALGAGGNVLLTVELEATAKGGPSAMAFVAGTLEVKNSGGADLATGWFAGAVQVL